MQFAYLTCVQGTRKDDGNQVVTSPRKLGTLERLVVNELYRLSIRLDLFNLKGP